MTSAPSEPFLGAVFDLNGTLIDDIRFHFEAWRDLAHKHGRTFDEATFQSWNGLKNEDIFPKFLGRAVTREELLALGEEKESAYRAMYRPHLAPVRGAIELLDRLRALGVRLAVASSAPPANREMALVGLGLTKHFDVVVEAEHLPGKPAPDVFLEAARRLGLDPRRCVAFEDAENGVRSAVAAGMTVVGITTNNPADVLRRAGAAFAASDMASLPSEIEARLRAL
jgi:HAD superfamily hydrolase (TIGR01509 family)